MSGLIITRAAVSDIPEIASAEALIFSDAWSESSLAESLSNPTSVFLVARAPGGELAGYGIEYCLFSDGEILNLAVLPEFRRLGYGAEILSAMLSEGEKLGAKSFFLEVRASNTPAKTLYEKFGFTELGVRKRYYTSPVEDAIEMILQR